MLDFFRKYQRYFFLVITVVIIISFSFFGTYSTLGSNTWREQIAFTAVNGREVTRSDVDEMALFLATDNDDKMLFGGMWGPNFLNDGVIRKDFLETGLAEELALAYQEDLQEDMNKRLVKEKKYTLYSHPQVSFLGVRSVWRYFAPQMNEYFDSLQSAEQALDPKAFKSRVQLYLAEKEIPAGMLRQILRYQENQYSSWLKPDDRLNQMDLSLFGYHTVEDWFGPHFTRLVSEFIINAAILAESQGYDVSKAEVLTDLVRNTQQSYQQNENNPNLGVASPEEYFTEQLRRLGMDQARAIKVWRQVLLFRRYFHDAGANALVDAFISQKLHHFANENVTVDLYRLPSELRLANYDDLQMLETYLYAAAKQSKTDPLAIPDQFLAVSDVIKKYPELVQKRYVLGVAQVNQKTLQAKIGLRELWNWEVEDQNWETLAKQFPTLGVKSAQSREERFEALDSLDPTTRSVVDIFAKQAIVKAHPEWITQALNSAKVEKMVVGLRTQGGTMPFSGLDDQEKRQEFIRLLDEAPISEGVETDSPLYDFSADQQVFYRIAVLDRAKEQEILTFAEANADDTLEDVRDRILEKQYETLRTKDASLYLDENKEWKPFDEVREQVADQYFGKFVKALEPVNKEISEEDEEDPQSLSNNLAASLRFYPYLKTIKERLEKDPTQADQWIKTSAKEKEEGEQSITLVQRPTLADQWKIEKTTITLNRQNPDEAVDMTEAYALTANEWSPLETPPNGDLAFYQVKERGEPTSEVAAVAEQTRQMQTVLGDEAQRHLMRQVLAELKSKNAISLAYLKIPVDEPPAQEPETIDPGY